MVPSITPIRIVIADDHPIVRKGLRDLLESREGFSVTGEAADGLEAIRLVEQLKPEVLLLDLMMPGLSGLEALRKIRRRSPSTRVIVFSMYGSEPYVLEALKGGATGFVLKDSAPADILTAIHEVCAGRHYLSPSLSEYAIEVYLAKSTESTSDPYETLTAREREVLYLAAEGRSTQETADRLFISPRTVETHRTHLMRKLGLHSQADLIHYAARRGLIDLKE